MIDDDGMIISLLTTNDYEQSAEEKREEYGISYSSSSSSCKKRCLKRNFLLINTSLVSAGVCRLMTIRSKKKRKRKENRWESDDK